MSAALANIAVAESAVQAQGEADLSDHCDEEAGRRLCPVTMIHLCTGMKKTALLVDQGYLAASPFRLSQEQSRLYTPLELVLFAAF